MLVPQLLLETLEDLEDQNFKTLKWYLSMDVLDGCRPIPKGRLENASRIEAVSKMIDSYGEESAVNVAIEILKKINNNYVAERLKKSYAAGKAAAASSSSASAAPAAPAAPVAPASMSAQEGSVIIAPTVSNGTTGTFNITINK